MGEIVTVGNGMGYKDLGEGDIPVYGTGGYMLSVDKALSYEKDAVGIGRKGTIDKPYILKAPFWTVDTLFYCIPKGNYDLDFVFGIFQNINWKQKDESTGVPSLSKVNINSTDISSPSFSEQQAIGAYFKNLDRLITLIEREYKDYNPKEKNLYTDKTLQDICLGLHSICKGAESKFFNGHTNITDSNFVTLGVKGLLQASKNIRSALLFNVLSYMSNELLTTGNTVASIDEFYLFLTNLTAVEYIRNFMKRVRKKESAVILASQNIEDFLVENVRELTKPLFSIPTHHFLFNAGTIDSKFYMDALQLEPSEFSLIRYPQRGVCLYKCGNERYCLCVHAPEHKERLFGSAGGR